MQGSVSCECLPGLLPTLACLLVPGLAGLLTSPSVRPGETPVGLGAGALIAAMYRAVPYDVGIDAAAGLGIGQALIIIYFHLGRGDFVHR